MKCCKISELMSDFLDMEREEVFFVELREHIEGCENCLALYRTMEKTIVLFRTYYRKTYRAVPRQVTDKVFYQLRIHYKK